MAEVATAVSQVSSMSSTVLADPIFGTVIKIAFVGIVLSVIFGIFMRKG